MSLQATAYKLSDEDREIIDNLAKKWGVKSTDVIRIAIRRTKRLEEVIDNYKLSRVKKEV